MAQIKVRYDSMDDVPEAYKALFVESGEGDDKFALLDAEGLLTKDDVDKVSRALQKERKDHRLVRTQSKQFRDLLEHILPDDSEIDLKDSDLDLDTLQETLEGLVAASDSDDDGKSADPSKIKTAVADALAKQELKNKRALDAKDVTIGTLTSNYHGLLIEQGLTAALVEHKVAEQFMGAVTALHKPRITIAEDETDGSFKAVVLDDNGVDQTVPEFVKEWAESDTGKQFVAADQNAGGGMDGQGAGKGNGAGENPFTTNNITEQMKLFKADPGQYQVLKDQHEARVKQKSLNKQAA